MSVRLDRLRSLWWEWSDASPNPRQRLPTVIQFPVNDICNSKCQMCHIWERKRDHEVSPEELTKILKNSLFREVREIGLNGGEPTLRKDLPELLQTAIAGLPKLRGVSLITNAIQEKQVIQMAEELGRRCADAGVHLDVMVSLDGIGEVHDRVRGAKGNFESANRVIDHLLGSSRIGSCRIGCTLIRENVYDAENVLNYARSKPIYARFRVGIPHRRLYTADLKEPFALNDEERYHLACFLDELRWNYEADPARRAFYLSLRNQIVYNADRAAGCAWKNRGITLTSRGELAYCAVQSPTLGSLLEKPADELYWSNSKTLQTILADHCAGCLHDYDGVQSKSLVMERVLRKRLARAPKPLAGAIRKSRAALSDRDRDQAARTATTNAAPASKRDGILLCGWYGTETLGDKAILSGLISSLRSTGWKGTVDLASLEPYVSQQTLREMPELGLKEILTIEDARKRVAGKRYEAVAIAGGPLMSPVVELFDLLGLFTDAAASQTKRAVLGCGVGPLGHSKRRDAAIAEILKLSNSTVLRDEVSANAARVQLGITEGAQVALDPAFIWARRQPELPKDPDGPLLLALRDWPLDEYAAGLSKDAAAELKARFELELVTMIRTLRELAPEIPLRPIPMHTHARGGDDRMFFQHLFPELAQSWKRSTPSEQFAEFQRARGVVAMRFHSVVLSIAAHTPFIAIDYTRGGKIAGLLKSIGNAESPLSIDTFSGEQAAQQILSNIKSKSPAPVPDVEATYTSAWQALLATP
jgi:polysaccharide pyruvyl transferase WcaK-like protein/MoaA/NifB/PqqE/SkfB family radical SAM enzyme